MIINCDDLIKKLKDYAITARDTKKTFPDNERLHEGRAIAYEDVINLIKGSFANIPSSMSRAMRIDDLIAELDLIDLDSSASEIYEKNMPGVTGERMRGAIIEIIKTNRSALEAAQILRFRLNREQDSILTDIENAPLHGELLTPNRDVALRFGVFNNEQQAYDWIPKMIQSLGFIPVLVEECPHCKGVGKLPEHPKIEPSGFITCSTCNGERIVEIPINNQEEPSDDSV